MKYSFHFRAERDSRTTLLAVTADTLEMALEKVKKLYKADTYQLYEVNEIKEKEYSYHFHFRSLRDDSAVSVFVNGENFAEVNEKIKPFFGDLEYKLDNFGQGIYKSAPVYDLCVLGPDKEPAIFATLYGNSEEEVIALANSVFPADYLVNSVNPPYGEKVDNDEGIDDGK